MNRPLISTLLIPFLLVYTYFSGCVSAPTKTAKIFPDQSSLTNNEKISAAVTRSGEKITFTKSGARYIAHCRCVGETVYGGKVSLVSENIAQYRLSLPDTVSWNDLADRHVTEAITSAGTLVEFEQEGGTLNRSSASIVGWVVGGGKVAFNRNGLRQIRTTRPTLATQYQVLSDTTLTIVELVGQDGQVYTMKAGGCSVLERESVLQGITEGEHGKFTSLPMDSVLYVQAERTDPVGQIAAGFLNLLVIGLVVGLAIGVVVALTKQSCPFVYSYDGTRYVFDAEPLGGATTRSLQRTDYSKMEYLRMVNGTYTVRVRNEVDETQYLDRMSLLEVDHDPSVRIIADQFGRFHGVRNPQPAVAALDQRGMSLLPFVGRQDSIFWQTDMESATREKNRPIRHSITFSFAKPPGARRALIVFHGGTTMWGSNMIREMYRLYGTSLDEYRKALDEKGAETYRMLRFIEREELYQLKMEVRGDTGWVQRGTIRGGGPYIYETQVIPLSVRKITSDTLTVRIHPPAGFWAIDYVGVEYDLDSVYTAKEIPLSHVTNQYGEDIRSTLLEEDGVYTTMPTTEDQFTAEFPASAERAGLARTLFLKTTGYYTLHLRPDTPKASGVLAWIGEKPGAIVEYSYQQYQRWKSSMAARSGGQ